MSSSGGETAAVTGREAATQLPPRAALEIDLRRAVLVGFSAPVLAHTTRILQQVAPAAELCVEDALDALSPAAPGTVFFLADGAELSAMEALELLRGEGVSAPVVLILEGEVAGVEPRGDLDLISLSELSPLSLRRSLVLFRTAADHDSLHREASQRLQAYETVLESKDEEKAWILKVTTALKHRLAEAEGELQQLETSWARRLRRAEERNAALERRLEGLEGETAGEPAAPPDREPLAAELDELRAERSRQDATIAELRRDLQAREDELEKLPSPATPEELANRLEASEEVRGAQTAELVNAQERLADLERQLAAIAELVQPGETGCEPARLLEELTRRLARFEKERREQQGTIDQLSRTLAIRQVDDTLDDGRARRNVVRQVSEAVRRSQRFGTPLICLMAGIDHADELREDLGALSYVFVLVQLAQRLRLSLRRRDVLMRYGEEGFLLISDSTSIEGARSHAERLIHTVCAAPVDLGTRSISPSVSVGILRYRPAYGEASDYIRLAHQTLEAAQKRGDRQILAGPVRAES